MSKFRRAGLRIKSVSLFDRLVTSCQGVGLKADLALAEVPLGQADECLLILPTGGRNGEALRRDARIKALLQALGGKRVRIALTDGRSNLASDIDALLALPTYRPENGQELGAFVESLADQLAFT
ncbi:MAG: DJ-1/PfpI family protein [Chloroflexi bacterium]|nr:DJ-1/PfpI family protein [Chloroflexota bacterium]MCI0578643.1 DJ-1/PfpI family protein [Chloroflexota bacterium]MCI0647216.1 DJ-1/PfpI family protein [Chloroflexota bacterium]MCI0728942.1 DJ-1/PfpI family protein [Chloroflexota bacterium]